MGKRAEIYGYHFARTTLSIDSYEEEINVWVMLDTLISDAPALTYEESRNFYNRIEADYAEWTSRRKRFEKVRENEFFNALQIKFAYAVTCHKAQGGQWDAVFGDQGWITEERMTGEYWRWLYTAVTRARKRLYFINLDVYKRQVLRSVSEFRWVTVVPVLLIWLHGKSTNGTSRDVLSV